MKNKLNKDGFSLVETLIALFVFSVVISTVGTAFVNVLNLQRRGFGAQKVQENGLFMLELMAREIRVSLVEFQDSPGCGLTTLSIIHPVNGQVVYAYDAVNKKITRDISGFPPTDLSSPEIAVNRLNFCVLGSNQADNQQARVTIIMQLQNQTTKTANTVLFDVQSTVTSRDITTEYQN